MNFVSFLLFIAAFCFMAAYILIVEFTETSLAVYAFWLILLAIYSEVSKK